MRGLPGISRMRRLRWAILLGWWAVVVAFGTWRMLSYDLTPAAPASPVRWWPTATQLVRDPGRPTLLMFVHPGCPCSRASLAELSRLLSPRRNEVAVRILMVRPAGLEAGWEKTDLWVIAQRIEGATVLCDPEGVEARRFGARTSGETMLFAPEGRLLFDGGITASRGHEGDNAGRDIIAGLIDNGGNRFRQTPVFGCALSNCCSSDTE
jgi:hypothetical protein